MKSLLLRLVCAAFLLSCDNTNSKMESSIKKYFEEKAIQENSGEITFLDLKVISHVYVSEKELDEKRIALAIGNYDMYTARAEHFEQDIIKHNKALDSATKYLDLSKSIQKRIDENQYNSDLLKAKVFINATEPFDQDRTVYFKDTMYFYFDKQMNLITKGVLEQ